MELLRTVPKCLVAIMSRGVSAWYKLLSSITTRGDVFCVLPPPSRTGHANAIRAAIGLATGDLYCMERMTIGLREKTRVAKEAPKFARADSGDGGPMGVGISF